MRNVSGITTRQGEQFPGAEPGTQFYPVSASDYLTGYLMAFGAMVALARRAREGGSWLVRISLGRGDAGLPRHIGDARDADLETLKGLVREGDVFSQGYRPGTLANRERSPASPGRSKKQGRVPRVLVTDKLKSYAAAKREIIIPGIAGHRSAHRAFRNL
jgi:hypothetical protein